MIAFGFLALTSRAAEPVEPLAWDSLLKEQSVKQGAPQAQVFFAVTNVSSSDVTITQVLTSCGCTVASLPSQPWRLPPGSDGKINASINLAGKFGTVIKTLTVISSGGNKVLTIKVNVPQPEPQDPEMAARIRNQEASKADRLAVFKNDCAQCHLEPAFGKTGHELYVGLCGVCHEATHRATMVPDLHTVNKENDPEVWRAFVKHGKVASLMPPFDESEGGPLNERQIDSLVAYLTTDFQKEARIVALPTPSPNEPVPLSPAPQRPGTFPTLERLPVPLSLGAPPPPPLPPANTAPASGKQPAAPERSSK
jgi:hypothetical protein